MIKNTAKKIVIHLLTFCMILPAFCQASAQEQRPAKAFLSSWHEGPSKQRIIEFVQKITMKEGAHFVPVSERIAVFDNDGTLWAEQPLYIQLQFALDRIKNLVHLHPEWKEKQPFKSALEGDMKTLMSGGKEAVLTLLMASHADTTTEEFAQIVKQWLITAKHPKTGRAYTEMIYQPMLELLNYLRANEFKTYIVSGGGVEFMRPWTEAVYGIPPEQVIGSRIKTKFELKEGQPVLTRLSEIEFINDKAGKPVGINTFIGRRPLAAFGNSDGDLQMLQWTTIGNQNAFGLIVHHTDAEREWAYDKDSAIGKLDKALVEAKKEGWTIVDMKRDWKVVFPPGQ